MEDLIDTANNILIINGESPDDPRALDAMVTEALILYAQRAQALLSHELGTALDAVLDNKNWQLPALEGDADLGARQTREAMLIALFGQLPPEEGADFLPTFSQLRDALLALSKDPKNSDHAQRLAVFWDKSGITAEQRKKIESQRTEIESNRAMDAAHRAQTDAEERARSLEVNARLTDLAREVRESDAERLEEQRVCFKQLSLEMSEAEVLLDRARRDIEARLDKLER